MALPATGPTTREKVKAHLRIRVDDTRDDVDIDGKVAAVNSRVRDWPVADKAALDTQEAADEAGWPASIVEGATMLAARLWRRGDSPAGVAAFGDFGPVYVQRNDPDVALLLELGDYSRPDCV